MPNQEVPAVSSLSDLNRANDKFWRKKTGDARNEFKVEKWWDYDSTSRDRYEMLEEVVGGREAWGDRKTWAKLAQLKWAQLDRHVQAMMKNGLRDVNIP